MASATAVPGGGGGATATARLTVHLPPRRHLSSFPSSLSPSPTGPALFPSLSSPTSSSSPSSFRPRAAAGGSGLATEEERRRKKKSFYELLGISEEGTFDDIKKAYKRKARTYHPDVSPPDRTEEYTRRFIEVQEAYETLSDPWTKALYDKDLARGLHYAFSARNRSDDGLDHGKARWRSQWQTQVVDLKNRGMYKDSDNMSWGARMRKQRMAQTVAP